MKPSLQTCAMAGSNFRPLTSILRSYAGPTYIACICASWQALTVIPFYDHTVAFGSSAIIAGMACINHHVPHVSLYSISANRKRDVGAYP